MYERIVKRQNSEIRRNSRLITALAICLVIVFAIILIVVWAMRYQRQFSNFIADLSRSTSASYQGDGLTAFVDGQEVAITGENAYRIYTYLTVYGPSHVETRSAQEDDAEVIQINYSDGAVLRLWDFKQENDEGKLMRWAHVSFTNASGEIYSYSTREVSVESIKFRYLTDFTNTEEADSK